MWNWLRFRLPGADVARNQTIPNRSRAPDEASKTVDAHAQLLEAIASGDDIAARDKLVISVGGLQAAEMIDGEIGSTLRLAQYTGNLIVLARLRPFVKALDALGDRRAAMYAEVATRRRFPGWSCETLFGTGGSADFRLRLALSSLGNGHNGGHSGRDRMER